MSQPIQQPPQPPTGGTPYGQQPFGQQPPGYGPAPQAPGQGFGQPVGQPLGQPLGQPFGQAAGQPGPAGYRVGAPGAAAAPTPSRLGAGVLAGALVMIVAALIYGFLLRALSNSDGSYHEFSYAALAVGLAVGAATGKVGGRHPALPFVGLVLAVVGVFFGEIFGLSLIASHISDGGLSVTNVLFQHFGVLVRAWKSEFDFMSAFFYLVAAFEGFVVTRRMANR